MNGKEYKLAIRIAGVVDKSFAASLATTKAGLRGLTNLHNDFEILDKGYNKIMKVGRKAFTAVATAAGVATLAIGAATAASIKVGSEFESAFTGVKKTVDATNQEYAMLRENIIEMSKEIPATASEIAGVMEIAGQLGIATDSLTDFTKTMINLGVSTNMSAEDAASSLARLKNIMGMADFDENGISNWERLGSTIVDLGNNFATTEEEIVLMATRLASTGDIVGLTEAQVLALSTAMSSVGIRTEAGGSTMSKLLKKMSIAVETNSADLEQWGSVANMTGEQFKKTFQEDAVKAVSAFIGGINDTERNGKSAIAILDEMNLKEIRLSNTILALAGAENVMMDAIDTANRAWEDNTALAIEAGKRYETIESQAQILKNTITALGIEAYDEMRPLLVTVLKELNSEMSEFATRNGIKEWVDKTLKAIPNFKRGFNEYVIPVLEGFKNFGEWIISNGINIVSVLGSIAAGLAAYKALSTTFHIVEGIMKLITTLSGYAPIIIGLVAVIGLAAGAIIKTRMEAKKLINQNLAEHFGNVSLSLEEIREVAEHILSSKNLAAIKRVSEEVDKLTEKLSIMDETLQEINKYNWMVSIGMELDEGQAESYKMAIENYVQAAEDFALQNQYTVSLDLGLLSDTNNPLVSSGIDNINAYYAGLYDDMQTLGTQLQETVNEAFTDGLLDPTEAGEIDKIVQNIEKLRAEVESRLARDEANASLKAIALKYSTIGLDSESFKNLQSELNTQIEENTEMFEEQFKRQLVAAEHAGSQAEKEAITNAATNDYFTQILGQHAQSINYQLETIYKAYGDELNPAIQGYMDRAREVISSYSDFDWGTEGTEQWVMSFQHMMEAFAEAAKNTPLDKSTKGALGELLKSMLPTIESVQAYRSELESSGAQLSENFVNGIDSVLSNYNILAALTGELSSAGYGVGAELDPAFTEFYSGVMEAAERAGVDAMGSAIGGNSDEIAKGFKTGLINSTGDAIVNASKDSRIAAKATEGANNIKNTTETTLNNVLGRLNTESIVDVTVTGGNIDTSQLKNDLDKRIRNDTAAWTQNVPRPKQNANGGIINRFTLSTLAEQGPEAVIPLNRTNRALSLWEKTGQLLGMGSVLDNGSLDTGGSNMNITYSPSLQFNGGTPSKEDITGALKMSYDEFSQMMDQYTRDRARVAF